MKSLYPLTGWWTLRKWSDSEENTFCPDQKGKLMFLTICFAQMTNVRFRRIDCTALRGVHIGASVNKALWLIVDGWVIGTGLVGGLQLSFTFPTWNTCFSLIVLEWVIALLVNTWHVRDRERGITLLQTFLPSVVLIYVCSRLLRVRDTYQSIPPGQHNLLPVWSHNKGFFIRPK